MTVHLCALEPNQQTADALLGFLKLVDQDDIIVCYGAGKSLIHWLFAKEALIESGASRLECKIVQFKAQTARNSKAIVKVCNAEMDDFTPQDAVSRFDQRFPNESDVPSTRQPTAHAVHEQLKQRLKQAQWFVLQEPAETEADQGFVHTGATLIGHAQLLALIRKFGPTVTWKR